jgi:hypothetical protein
MIQTGFLGNPKSIFEGHIQSMYSKAFRAKNADEHVIQF